MFESRYSLVSVSYVTFLGVSKEVQVFKLNAFCINSCLLKAKVWADFEKKMRRSYWTALKMNWKVWTPFQFINVNFVPVQVQYIFFQDPALFSTLCCVCYQALTSLKVNDEALL